MHFFLILLLKLLPIYGVMAAGYYLARATGNITGALAALQIYFIAPVVIFTNVSALQMSWHLAILPIMLFFLCCAIGTAVYLSTRHRKDGSGPLLGQASGTANMGYLGVPVALAIFPETILPVYLFTLIASTVYENSLGYYFIARGRFTPKDALLKLIKLPTVYALAGGLMYGALHFGFPESWQNIIRDFRGSYVILGSLIVGIGLGQVKKWEFDPGFFGVLLGIKFIIWPLAALAVVTSAQAAGVIEPLHAKAVLLMSILPLAANTAAFAALVGVHPEKAATAVALSTVLSLITLPVSAVLLGLV